VISFSLVAAQEEEEAAKKRIEMTEHYVNSAA
jgi:hypothetical protein